MSVCLGHSDKLKVTYVVTETFENAVETYMIVKRFFLNIKTTFLEDLRLKSLVLYSEKEQHALSY